MTREEAINYLFSSGMSAEQVQTVVKALEQEPCGDAISRQAAIRIAEQGQVQGYEWQFKQLCDLPSVNPQEPKTGCEKKMEE